MFMSLIFGILHVSQCWFNNKYANNCILLLGSLAFTQSKKSKKSHQSIDSPYLQGIYNDIEVFTLKVYKHQYFHGYIVRPT